MDINTAKIQAELQELDAKTVVKLSKSMACTDRIDFRDKKTTVTLNPVKIKTQTKLDEVLTQIRKDIGG